MIRALKHWSFRRPELNPIVIKEMRQAVRSRFVTGAIAVLLSVQLLGTAIYLMSRSMRELDPSTMTNAGRDMFVILLSILSVVSVLFVPLYTALRLAYERGENNLDLYYITAITPGAVVRGKVAAAAVITFLLFSLFMPFMSFTYLLRGIDLPSVFVILAGNYLAIMLCSQAGVFLACIPASRVFKILLGLAACGWLLSLSGMLISGFGMMFAFGVGSTLTTWNFWGPALLALGLFVTAFGLLHVLSIALLTPVSANRAWPVRAFVTAAWLSWGIAVTAIAFHEGESEAMFAWAAPATILLCVAVFFVVCEADRLSARVRRSIPRRRLLRPVFLLYSGPASGILWVLLLGGLTAAWTIAVVVSIDGAVNRSVHEFFEIFAGGFLYIFGYATAGLLLWRLFLHRRTRQMMAAVLGLLLIAAGSTLPYIAAFATQTLHRRAEGAWRLGNVFTLGHDLTRPAHLMFAGALAVSMTLVHLPWIVRQVRDFRPSESPPPITDAS